MIQKLRSEGKKYVELIIQLSPEKHVNMIKVGTYKLFMNMRDPIILVRNITATNDVCDSI